MKSLLIKEFRLATHPTVIVFLLLSCMLLIPNYPYGVVFFYTSLGLFFVCLTGRENHDIEYSLALPIRKRDIVKARFLFAAAIQLAQALLMIPFAILRQSFPLPGNAVGMDANVAFFGLSFLMLGIFNLIFFTRYYQNPDRVGSAFVFSSAAVFLYLCFTETLTHVSPFFQKLDTPDPLYLSIKLPILFLGLLLYAAATLLSYRLSARRFETLDF